MSDPEWKLVTSYTISLYECGLRAGDRVALRHDLVIRDHRGQPTGQVYPAGEVWQVLHSSEDDPGVIWFRQADGRRHTWDDDLEVFDTFEVIHRTDA
jgi:hypothetical protein